eukprot:TRINITY_DN1763_c0_g1_i1.p2 TRINITY_DN1763_c0_g1~~TRINITY_DN1763_c0_g1_i1.p2  ORF type:complete len:419 (-),score=65.85 TRINITY_DN1763_c0_g1_i1:584-1840(-)
MDDNTVDACSQQEAELAGSVSVPKNPWGKVQNMNWAEDVENAERSGELKVIEPASATNAEDQQLQKVVKIEEDDEEYPSLDKIRAQGGKKGSKKKGGKNQKLSLHAFQAQGIPESFNVQAMRMSLPSHSRERGPNDEERRRPFGNDGYDGGYGRRGGRGDGGFERNEYRGERRPRREDNFEPSEADRVDDWGSANKFAPSRDARSKGFSDYKEPNRPSRRGGGGGFGDSYRPSDYAPSEADTKNSWQSERPPPRHDYASEYQPPRRQSAGGYGPFSDGRGPPPRRTAGFVADSRADYEEKWSIGSKYSQESNSQGPFSSIRSDRGRRFDSRVGYSDTDRWSRNAADDYHETYTPPAPQHTPGAYVPPSQRKDPFAGARPREEVLEHTSNGKMSQQENGVHDQEDHEYYEQNEVDGRSQ